MAGWRSGSAGPAAPVGLRRIAEAGGALPAARAPGAHAANHRPDSRGLPPPDGTTPKEDKSFLETPAVAAAPSFIAAGVLALAGQSINHYKIIRQIGSGGMGDVYLAEDTRLGRQVAIKLLPALFTTDPDRLRRFAQEARAASVLSHSNVCTVHAVGEMESGQHYIVMEYVEGVTLRRHMQDGPLQLGEALDIGVQIAGALSSAHAAGIVHRDIKPENIMVRRDRIIKVLDFGLAKLMEPPGIRLDTPAEMLARTNSGIVMGTTSYMPPEQARGLAVDARADVWSLGVVLYEMVAGCAPFAGATPSDIIVAILQHEPPPLARHLADIPAELQRIISKALRKDREERYQVIKDMLLPMFGERQPRPFLRTPFYEWDARFSPDGRWVAYLSNETGRDEIFVRAVQASPRKWQISTAGGASPRWRRDGKELFYLAHDHHLMAVPLQMGATIEAGTPVSLFPVEAGVLCDVTADGQRFLVKTISGIPPLPITVVLNWTADIKH